MINGHLPSTRIPYLPITVDIPEKNLVAEFTALVDTGFTAELVVPQIAVAGGVPALVQSDVRLAGGSRVTVPGCLGNVRIGGKTIGPVLVMVMGDEAIIGLEVITQFRMTIDHDASLTFEP